MADELQKLRLKFPAYNDLSDQELASKVVAKYPQYQDILGNISNQPSIPQSNTGGVAEQGVKTMMAPYQAGANFDIKSPQSAVETTKALGIPSGIPAFLEGLGNKVKSASTAALGNLLTSNKIPGQNYPVARGAGIAAIDTALSLAPFSPSGFASYTPIPSLFSSPENIQSGIGQYAKEMKGNAVAPEILGGSIKDAYAGGYGKNLSDLESTIGKQPEVQAPNLTPSPEKIPTKAEIPMEEQIALGKNLQEKRLQALASLKQFESEKTIPVINKYKTISPDFSNSNDYIASMGGGDVQPSSLSQLNPALRDIALKQPDPESYAQSLIEVGKKNPDQLDWKTTEPPATPNKNPSFSKTDYSDFNNIAKAASSPNTTLNDLKNMRTKLGYKIDWNTPRGDVMNYHRIQLYNALGKDIFGSLEKAGVPPEETIVANQATKDVYNFLDKGMVDKIGSSEYPEDITRYLASKNSPSRMNQIYDSLKLNDAEKNKIQGTFESPDIQNQATEQQNVLAKQKVNQNNQLIKNVSSLPGVQSHSLSEIIPPQDTELNNIINKSHPSQLVSDLVSNNTKEVMDAAKRNLDPDSLKFVQRGTIQKIIGDNISPNPKDGEVDLRGLGTDIRRLKDSGYLDSLYGKDSQEIKTLGEISDYASGIKSGGKYIPMPWKYRIALRVLGGLMPVPGSESGVMSMAEKGGGINVPALQNMINPPNPLSLPVQRAAGLAEGLLPKPKKGLSGELRK